MFAWLFHVITNSKRGRNERNETRRKKIRKLIDMTVVRQREAERGRERGREVLISDGHLRF